MNAEIMCIDEIRLRIALIPNSYTPFGGDGDICVHLRAR